MKNLILVVLFLLPGFASQAQIITVSQFLQNKDIKLAALTPAEAFEACEIALESPNAHLLAYMEEYSKMSSKAQAEVSAYIHELFQLRVQGLIVLKSRAAAKAAKASEYRLLKFGKRALDSRYGNKLRELQRVIQGGWKWLFRKVFSSVEPILMGDAIQTSIDFWDEYFLSGKSHHHAMFEIIQAQRRATPGRYNLTQDQRTCMEFADEGFPDSYYSLHQVLKSIGE